MNCLYFIEFIPMIFKFKLKNKNTLDTKQTSKKSAWVRVENSSSR